MAYNPPTCPHCGGLGFQPCEGNYVNSVLDQANILVICHNCNELMIVKPATEKPLKDKNYN